MSKLFKANKANGRAPTIRLIGGQWRGRRLPLINVPGLRPTGDRIRETLFNWLAADLVDSVCLDLFAGSGALGFEALSRGASKAILIDSHPRVFAQLQRHVEQLSATRAQLFCSDVLQWLTAQSMPMRSVNIVFVDPPFADNLWKSTFAALIETQILADNAKLYVESPRNQRLILPDKWQVYREKLAGDVCYRLLIAT
ncbi:MAG: 16S rRNA (guanine966-N2)-methyltransferase [Cellvibrionaceae bacterium]|jgi:16S rRNA (guanine966-N2)-methyltransferase